MIITRNNSLLVIFGPTAVGKTDFALEIAHKIQHAEIINMDMGQFYVPLSIGTAKPDWRSYKVPHHLFDILDEPKSLTVVAYRDLVMQKVQEIWDKGNLPILVGGSGFYLKSLIFTPQVAQAYNHAHVYPENLWQALCEIDPVRAAHIKPNDTYRLKRAFDIWFATGDKPSVHKPICNPFANIIVLNLMRERTDLYERINKRVDLMMEQGWLAEVQALKGTLWEPFLKEKKLIGYNELLNYMDGSHAQQEYEELLKIIKQRTRHYAKRQMTFARMLEKEFAACAQSSPYILEMLHLDLTLLPLDLYINQLLHNQLKRFLY